MMANSLSSAAAPVPKMGIDSNRVFLSTIVMTHAREMENPFTTLTLEPMANSASTLREPVFPDRQYAVEIIEEAFRCDCMPGIALETVLDHVRSRR